MLRNLSKLNNRQFFRNYRNYTHYFTTPIFYVNADPHIGHLYSIVVTDALARYSKLANPNDEVVYSTGTDEHGMKVQQAAADLNTTPKELCDRISGKFRDLAKAALSSHTDYIRTTDDQHVETVHNLWNTLLANGYIYKGVHEGWYAVSDEAFYPESGIKEMFNSSTGETYKISIETGKRVDWMSETNYKFKLAAFRLRLIEWLENNPEAIQPRNQYNVVLGALRNEEAAASDLSISRPRSRLEWGINVPGDPEHTIYVWVDALANYLSVASRHNAWPADVHVVGKDIIRFHAVYWPALLLASNNSLPRTILSHAHWTMNGSKMSKSTGNVVDPFEVINKYSADVIRYYLLRVGGNLSNDADFKPNELDLKYKSTLQAMLGNLLSRISGKKIVKRVESAQQNGLSLDPTDSEKALYEKLKVLESKYSASMERFELGKALEVIEDTLHEANRYFTKLEPWSDKTPIEDCAKGVLYARETLRIVGILLQPVMPEKSRELLDRLGLGQSGRNIVDAELNLSLTQSLQIKTSKNVLFPPLIA